ncbi:MAG TPA: AAA family ATPase [Terrimicrobiaceae bacterium]
MPEISSDSDAVKSAAAKLHRLRSALNQVLFGQEGLIDMVLTGLLSRGHLLLEGLPGLGKTALVKGLASALQVRMQRVQFTPDLLPGDITGNPILQEVDGRRVFVFERGPIFANLLLADEINRASPKTQSALLEAMQERRVTVMGETHELPAPFFVLATQNPIELEGTYPLPEAQLDRFLFKLQIARNSVPILQKIVQNRQIGVEPIVEPVIGREELIELCDVAAAIHLPDVVANYIARIVTGTHEGSAAEGVKYGASPRAAIALAAAARSAALLAGRLNASFEDVERLAAPVLQHRIILDYTARLAGKTSADVVRDVLAAVPKQDKSAPDVLKAARV